MIVFGGGLSIGKLSITFYKWRMHEWIRGWALIMVNSQTTLIIELSNPLGVNRDSSRQGGTMYSRCCIESLSWLMHSLTWAIWPYGSYQTDSARSLVLHGKKERNKGRNGRLGNYCVIEFRGSRRKFNWDNDSLIMATSTQIEATKLITFTQ